MFDQRRLRRLDWPLLLFVCGVLALALPTLYSASLASESAPNWYYLKRQMVGLLVGLLALLAANSLDHRHFAEVTRPVYWACIGLLIVVLAVGREVNGATSWLVFGGFRLQPSEVAKLALILALAQYFADDEVDGSEWPCLFRSLLILAVPVGLILLQPDLGTALTFFACWLVMLWWSGARWWHVLLILAAGLLAAAALWQLDVLQPYQKARVTVLFNPDVDPRGQGYNLRQALVAVGSGGVWGQGWLQGTQTHLGFLPEKRTDFIFGVLAEEGGLVAAALLLLFYGGILWRCTSIILAADSRYGRLLAVGCLAFLLVHLLLNLGMVVGLMPITGLPLPFCSYGSSNLVTNFALLGILLNVGMRRGGMDL